MTSSIRAAAWPLVFCILISGCGQKGPLFIPKEERAAQIKAKGKAQQSPKPSPSPEPSSEPEAPSPGDDDQDSYAPLPDDFSY